MSSGRWDRSFLASTRGRIVALLRRRAETVDELAQTLGLTDNAVRAHLVALERDGLVERGGIRRGPSKPAYTYDLTPEAEQLFSRAYVPVLEELLAALLERDSAESVDVLLQSVGRRLAPAQAPAASFETRLARGLEVLNDLGGVAESAIEGDTLHIRGYRCPLASVTSHFPAVCQAVAALLTEVVGVPIRAECEGGERPSCCFMGTLPRTARAGHDTLSANDDEG